jgi:hypothetical protein
MDHWSGKGNAMAYARALSTLAARGIFEPQVATLAREEKISLMAAARRLLAATA